MCELEESTDDVEFFTDSSSAQTQKQAISQATIFWLIFVIILSKKGVELYSTSTSNGGKRMFWRRQKFRFTGKTSRQSDQSKF
jgi:hypothetical protein